MFLSNDNPLKVHESSDKLFICSVCVCSCICTYKQKEPLSRNLQMNTQKIPEETGACALYTAHESTYMLMKVPFHPQTNRGDGENYYFKIESFTSRPEVLPAFLFYGCVMCIYGNLLRTGSFLIFIQLFHSL